MMKRFIVFILPLLILIWVGCSKTTDNNSFEFDEAEDNATIQSLLIEQEGETDSFRTYTNEIENEEGENNFFRRITSREVTFHIVFQNDNYAEVTKNITVEGIFNILTDDSLHYEKPFTEYALRTFDLQREPTNENDYRGWKVVKTSGKEFWSDTNNVKILQLQVISDTIDSLITSISEKIELADIIKLPRNAEVTLIVQTTNIDDEVYLHHPVFQRRKFTNNGDGTYTTIFTTPQWGIYRRFGIDVLSHDTLYNLVDDYDSKGWGIPFKLD